MAASASPNRGPGHYLLAPALAVINRLRYPHKFILISLLFALPLGLVLYLFISDLNERIAFTQKELDGTEYLRPLRKAYEHVAQSRVLAREHFGGKVGVRPDLIRKQAEIDEDFAALEAVERTQGKGLRSSEKYDALRENRRFLREKLFQLDATDCDGLHVQLLADIRALALHVGDTSNLILDPDLDSYYLMDAVLLKLPQSRELVVEARAQGRVSITAGGMLTSEQRSEFSRLSGLIRSNLEETKNGIGIAFKNNPSNTLDPNLEDALRRWSTETEAFLAATDKKVINPRAVEITADEYDRLGGNCLAANFDLWDRAVKDLDAIMVLRRDAVVRKKHLMLAVTSAALLLVAYLWFAFYVGVMRTVSRLKEASERMLGGSIDHIVTLETKDELGQVATSFNNIAARLRTEWVQAREESARAISAEGRAQRQAATVELLQAVSAAANEATSFEAALRIGIERVCGYAGWPIGHAYVPAPDGSGQIVDSGIWHPAEPAGFAHFRKVVESGRYATGVGLPGRVLAANHPDWITDLAKDPAYRRALTPGEQPLNAAYAFPVRAGHDVVAVLEFFSPTFAEPDGALMDAMTNIGAQIGLVHERQRGESELRQAQALAENANAAKSVFLATMSHEIRTPLNAVLGMASLLQDTDLNTQQHEFARVIRTSGEALLGVINDILDFSKIEAGHLEIEKEPFDLRACVEGATDVIAVRGSEKGLELAYHIDPNVPDWLVGDVTRVRQILINLLSNAVKFTEKGEVVVTVTAVAASEGRHEVTFAVRDTGIGIPPDRISRLFRSFSQVDASTTRKYGGTGLGLVISKKLAEMMGGRMWVTSESGIGSVFSFSIVGPAAAAPSPSAENEADLGILTGKRLLIVDDNETNRRIVRLLAEGWGLTARDTGSPLEALRWLDAGEAFDLGIFDINMPEMDGTALAAAVRERPGEIGKMPLVAFTSLTRREALGDRREFNGFVTKPLKPGILLEVLLALLSGREVRRGDRLAKSEFDKTLGQRFPLRLLVADDVPVNQQMMRVMLGRMAYDADFAENGVEVLKLMDRREYDLIFMDMQMPEMDGIACTCEIRRRESAERRTPVVALTANVTSEDAQRCREAGMDGFLTKPVKPIELRKCLEEWGGLLADRRPKTAPEEPSAAPELLIDDVILADLRDLDEGEPGLLKSFVEGLRAAVVEHVPLLRQAIADGNGERLRQFAHRLKGTAANVGACAVAERCTELEQLGRNGNLGEGAAIVRKLELQHARTADLFIEKGM